jgi:hypothetical protein
MRGSAALLCLGSVYGRAQKLVRLGDSLLSLREGDRRTPQLSDAGVPGAQSGFELRLSQFEFSFRHCDH